MAKTTRATPSLVSGLPPLGAAPETPKPLTIREMLELQRVGTQAGLEEQQRQFLELQFAMHRNMAILEYVDHLLRQI